MYNVLMGVDSLMTLIVSLFDMWNDLVDIFKGPPCYQKLGQ